MTTLPLPASSGPGFESFGCQKLLASSQKVIFCCLKGSCAEAVTLQSQCR